MSTNSTTVGTTRSGLTISASSASRGSGTGTTPTFGSMVQNGKLAAAMPALVSALKSVDLPTFGRPTMPHWMPMFRGFRDWWFVTGDPGAGSPVTNHESGLAGVQALHRLVEVTLDGEREDVERVVDRPADQDVVLGPGTSQDPRGHPVLEPGLADADAQPVEAAVAKQAHDVAQAVLAAVAAVELQPRHAGRQVELVMGQQRLFGLDLPVAQGSHHRLATEVHERGRAQQPQAAPGHLDLRGLAEQLALGPEARPGPLGQGVHETEPGVMPGPCMFGPRVAEADDEPQSFHSLGSVPAERSRSARGRGRAGPCRTPGGAPHAVGAGHPPPDRDHLPSSALAAASSPSAASSGAASSRPCLAITTASSWSLPSLSCGTSTPWGSCQPDGYTMSSSLSSDGSHSTACGRSDGSHSTVPSSSSRVITTSAAFPAGGFSSLTNSSGTAVRSVSLSFTRWKSRCRISCLYGWRWMSRSSTFWMSPPRLRSRIDE